MSRKKDVKLTIPSISDPVMSNVLSKIVENLNNIMSELDETKRLIESDAKRNKSISNELDTIGRLRIKKISKREFTIEARTNIGWKEVTLVDSNGENVVSSGQPSVKIRLK